MWHLAALALKTKIAIAAGAGAAGLLGYDVFKKIKNPQLQSMKGTTPSGVPMQVVVPVQDNPVTPPIANAVSKVIHLGYLGNVVKAVNPTQPTIITPTGASNFQVNSLSDVQRALNTLGYFFGSAIPVDGTMNQATKAGISIFEQKHGMPIDGQDSATLRLQLEIALAAAGTHNNLGSQPAVQNAKAPPPQINSLRDVQIALNILGASPQLVEDGINGPKTIAAVKAFQQTHGLTVDGIAGPKTKTALAMALSQLQSTQINGDLDISIRHSELHTPKEAVKNVVSNVNGLS
jgi:peptidoglycan hydrolase-like protein with peptidoglycan-binding domain